MKIFLILVVILIVLIGITYCVGLLLPSQCIATRTVVLPAPLAMVFEIVTNNSKAMQWRTDLDRLQILDSSENKERWVEYPKKGNPVTFIAQVKEPYSLYEISMTDNKVFEGYWRGFFESHSDGTKVIFTEVATIANPLYRIFSMFFFDLGKTIDQYIVLLSNALEKQRVVH